MDLKKLFSVRDVTQGRPWKRIAELAIPLLIGNLAQTLYNTVDTIVVGKYVGDNALSAVGASGPIMNLIFIMFIGVATGASILVAQRFGAKDREGLSEVIGNVMFLSVVSSFVTAAIGLLLVHVPLFGGKDILQLMNTPEGDIYNWSKEYLTVIFIGVLGGIVYNMVAGILRGLGDSVSALVYLLITCGLNIALDLWFVAGFGLGVFGVALATVISQFISCILCVIKLFRMNHVFDFSLSSLKPDGKVVGNILGLGMPAGIGQGIRAMSAVLVQSLTNSMGPIVMACSVMVMRIDSFAMMPYMSIGTAMTTYAGQNYGAKKLERLETGGRQGIIMSLLTAAVLTSCILIFGRPLARIFTQTEELIDLTIRMLRVMAAGYLVNGMAMALQGFLRGVGDTKNPMWINIMTQILLRLPLAYLLARLTRTAEFPHGQAHALFLSLVTSWVVGAFASVFFYMKNKKKLRESADDTWQTTYEE